MEHYRPRSLGRSQWNTRSLGRLQWNTASLVLWGGCSGTLPVSVPAEVAVEHFQSRSLGRLQWNTASLVPRSPNLRLQKKSFLPVTLDSLQHSFIYSFTHSLSHSRTHSFVSSFGSHSFFHLLTHPSISSTDFYCIHPFSQPLTV